MRATPPHPAKSLPAHSCNHAAAHQGSHTPTHAHVPTRAHAPTHATHAQPGSTHPIKGPLDGELGDLLAVQQSITQVQLALTLGLGGAVREAPARPSAITVTDPDSGGCLVALGPLCEHPICHDWHAA